MVCMLQDFRLGGLFGFKMHPLFKEKVSARKLKIA